MSSAFAFPQVLSKAYKNTPNPSMGVRRWRNICRNNNKRYEHTRTAYKTHYTLRIRREACNLTWVSRRQLIAARRCALSHRGGFLMVMMMVMMMLLLVLDNDFSSQHRWRWQLHIGFQGMRVQGFVQQHIAKNFTAIIGNFSLWLEKWRKGKRKGERQHYITHYRE